MSKLTHKFILFTFLILFAFINPASADYIGPDRTVTTYTTETVEYGVWADSTDNSCNPINGQACIQCDWEDDPFRASCAINPPTSTYYYYSLGFTTSVVEVQTTYPAATVNGTLQNCTMQNGWCVTSPQLQITANEPVSGYNILLIEGIYNSEIFACAENPCIFPFTTEGNHAIEYWALSSWGDSSTKKTTTIKVDTVAPNLNLLVNGTLGSNNWYVSNTTITAIGQDDTSGIYEQVLSIDNGTTWIPSTTLTDGVYQVDIKVTDNAYNVSTASTTLQVDTTTPTLSLSISGTKGNNSYYVSKPKITTTTFDATSGIALVQAKIDNGNWIDANEITIEDGIRTYQFRVYDNAGNVTETPVQNIKVDTTPPIVDADTEINLGNILFFTLRDNGSGLAIERIVIEDEDEKYKKIVWLQEISGNKIEGDILWDGKFPSNTLGTSADKTLAGVGEYFITFKISDRAGNETFYTSIVNVNPISYLQSIPEFIPPETSNEPTSELENEETTNEQSFGGETALPNNTESTTQTLEFTSSATAGMNTTSTNPSSNILWGAIAASAIGWATAIALEQQKKREEEEQQSLQQAKNQAEKFNEAEAERKANLWLQGQATLEAWIEQLEKQGASQEDIDTLREQAQTQGFGVAHNTAGIISATLQEQKINEMIQADMTEDEKLEAYKASELYQAQQAAYEEWQAQQDAQGYQEYRQGEYVSMPIPLQEENLWDKAWNWAFNNQTELSFGTGIAIGAVAAVAIVAGIITAPAWIVIGGVALLTAGIITAGTLAINYHFGLEPSNNLVDNIITGVVPALALTGVGYLLATVAPLVVTGATNLCANNPTACSYVGPVVDFAEQAIIATQYAYYGLVGDQENLAMTTVEWQMELNDGGMPGNTLFNEASQQLSRLGPDALELFKKYGNDVIPLLLKHEDEVVRFTNAGEEVIDDILKNFGDDTVTYTDDVIDDLNATVLGRLPDTHAAQELGLDMLNDPNWSEIRNFEWLREKIDNGEIFYIGSQINEVNLLSSNPNFGEINIFARELDMLLQNGYVRVGDYLIPDQ